MWDVLIVTSIYTYEINSVETNYDSSTVSDTVIRVKSLHVKVCVTFRVYVRLIEGLICRKNTGDSVTYKEMQTCFSHNKQCSLLCFIRRSELYTFAEFPKYHRFVAYHCDSVTIHSNLNAKWYGTWQLFNNGFSDSDYISSNDRVISDMHTRFLRSFFVACIFQKIYNYFQISDFCQSYSFPQNIANRKLYKEGTKSSSRSVSVLCSLLDAFRGSSSRFVQEWRRNIGNYI